VVVSKTKRPSPQSNPVHPFLYIPVSHPEITPWFLIVLQLQETIFGGRMKNQPTTYTVSFDPPVCIKGVLSDGPTPVMASYLYTGEGVTFKREIRGSPWSYLDVFVSGNRSKENPGFPPVKFSIVVPNNWDTLLILALIVKYVRENDTLWVDPRSGRVRDIFEWFVQEPNSVRQYLAKEDVYKSIEAREDRR
jgi:hypothetical protein